MKDININIGALWDMLSSKMDVEEVGNGENPNFLIRPKSGTVKVRVGDYGSGVFSMFDRKKSDTYSDVVCLSRHFVTKPIYTIRSTRLSDGRKFVLKTTNDHTCAVYNELFDEMDEAIGCNRCICEIGRYSIDSLIGFKSAKELKVGDRLPVLDEIVEKPKNGGNAEMGCSFDGERKTYMYADGIPVFSIYASTGVATVDSVEEDENEEGCWVYDLEVESGMHVYYANGVLVHNSQFINLSPITRSKCREAGISEDTRFSELPEDVRKSVIEDAYNIMKLVNANVEQLINTNCYTTQGSVLRYALEYIAAEGFYFKKKHYIVHKIISDDLPCDKFKYSGISVKKAEIPASMKTFLKDIYENTMTRHWTESDYISSVNEAYRKFIKLDWGDMSFYKKLRTPKAAISLTKSEKGAGVHARAANIYNGMLEELNIGGKYPNIGIGDEMRYSYVLPTNQYGLDVIGFKGIFPEEFRSLFHQDYNKMFDKIFTKSLENYVNIMNYSKFDPTKSVEDASFDIF